MIYVFLFLTYFNCIIGSRFVQFIRTELTAFLFMLFTQFWRSLKHKGKDGESRKIGWLFSYNKPKQCIKKQKHHFADKGLSSQSYGFSSSHVQMWSWTIKKAECWRTDAFKLWYSRRLLRVSWTARRSNQSVLKEISPEYSLEGLMLMLKLQYSSYLM